ncbi:MULTISPECIES: small membrane protein YoaI [unclassified Enterobacter]
MLIETTIITGSFFTIAMAIVLSIMLLERND